MIERITSNSLPVKLLRVVLAFTLVFWVSFRAEAAAFAALVPDGPSSGILSDAEVWSVDRDDTSVLSSKVWSMGETNAGDKQKNMPKVSAWGGSVSFVVTDLVWTANDQPGTDEPGGNTGGGDSGGDSGNSGGSDSGSGSGSGGDSGGSMGGDSGGGDGGGDSGGSDDPGENGSGDDPDNSEDVVEETAPIAPLQTQADDIRVADFLSWSVADESLATIEWRDGVATLTGKAPGRVTVYCDAAQGYDVYVPSDFTAEHLIQFDVQIVYIDSILLFTSDPAGNAKAVDGTEIKFGDVADGDTLGLWALVNAADGVEGDGSSNYTVAPGQSLARVSGGLLNDLEWSVADASTGSDAPDSLASLAGPGQLVFPGETPVVVKCSTLQGFSDGTPFEKSVTVVKDASDKKDDEEDIQGESHPQNRLTVEVVKPATGKSQSSGESGESGEGAAEDGTDAGSEESDAAASGEDGASGSDDAGQTVTTTKEFGIYEGVSDGVSDLEALGLASKTYEIVVDGEQQTVTGRGFTMAKLLDAAGVSLDDQANIESIDFVNFYGTTTTVSWHDMVTASQAADTYVILAAQSYIHPAAGADGQPSASDADESGETSEEGENAEQQPAGEEAIPLVDNTRFRLLFDDPSGSSGVNFKSLRWINKVVVHMQGEEPPKVDPYLRVGIDYVAVPKGQYAFLSAVPNQEVGTARFGFTWERSTDGGATWSVVEADSAQTLRVMTDDEHIGNLYRVTLETDLVDEETGETRSAVSDPVEITIGSGYMVVLDYIPKLAGDWAVFQAHIIITDGSSPTTEYCWEKSTDGGVSWQGINGDDVWVTDDALRVKTNPIDENASSDDGSEAVLTYVRVRAHASDGRNATSNAQALTVHPGDESGGGQPGGSDSKSEDIENVINNTDPATGGSTQEQGSDSSADSSSSTSGNGSSSGGKRVSTVEVSFDDDDFDDEDDDDDADDAEGASDPKPEAAKPTATEVPDKLIVSEEVNEKVAEQEQQAQEAKNAQPGARWTELSTVNPTSDDVRKVLSGNPFAPLAVPVGLGITAAGLVEKLVAFRRQL